MTAWIGVADILDEINPGDYLRNTASHAIITTHRLAHRRETY